MKILCPAILDGYQRRKDRSVSLRLLTQEQTSQDLMNIDSLLDTFGILYFRADDSPEDSVPFEELDSIELDLYDKKKTQSQRLRAVLYKLYKQEGGEGEFKDYYKVKTEKIIQHFKSRLEDE